MKYCPVCREEFMDHIMECPDDHVMLVDALDPVLHEDDVKQVLLYDFSNRKIAEMVQEVLENSGITPLLKSDMFASALAVDGSSPIGTLVKMYVKSSDLELARELTEGMVEESPSE